MEKVDKDITPALVMSLAELTRIEISPERAETLAHDFQEIFGYVDQIKELAAQAPSQKKAGVHANVFRDDTNPHEPGLYTDALLDAAPVRDGQFVKVKKILGTDT